MSNKDVHQLLRDPFIIDPSLCLSASRVLKRYERPAEEHPWANLSVGQKVVFKIAFISICHSINWDYLQGKLAGLVIDDPDNFVSRISSIRSSDVSLLLSDYAKQERVKPSSRAAALRNVGQIFVENWRGDGTSLLDASGYMISGSSGFLSQLDKFKAFSADPLRKKSHVLVHDFIREGIAEFKDANSTKPAIDYHIMRLYLRTGRVVPRFKELNPFLQGHPKPRYRLVQKLREAVSEAAELTAFYAGISVPDLNYIEWQFGRGICIFDAPRCDGIDKRVMPDDISKLMTNSCPYSDFCSAKQNNGYEMYVEPKFDQGYY